MANLEAQNLKNFKNQGPYKRTQTVVLLFYCGGAAVEDRYTSQIRLDLCTSALVYGGAGVEEE